MRNGLLIISVALLLQSSLLANAADGIETVIADELGTQNRAISVLSNISVPGGDASAVGRGFSSIGNDWRGACVDISSVGDQVPVETAKTNFEMQRVDTAEEYSNVMNMSVSASMSYGIYSGDLSARYMRRIIRNSKSHYIAGKVTVYTKPISATVVGLNKLGKRALSSGKRNFHRTCGDQFATSVVNGGELIFMLEITTKDDQEYESSQLDIDASVGNFGSGAGSFSQAISKLSQNHTLNITIVRNGLRDSLPVELTPSSLEKYALEFPERVTADNGIHMYPVRYGTLSYATIDVNAPTYVESNLFINSLGRNYVRASAIAGEIDYWKLNTDQFFSVSAARAEKMERQLTAATAEVEALEIAVQRCVDDPINRCAKVPVSNLEGGLVPTRLGWSKLDVASGIRVPLGVVPDGEERRVRFRGIWSAWNNGAWLIPEGHWQVDITDLSGNIRTTTSAATGEYPATAVATSGERVAVWLKDDPYDDNRQNSANPASATLY